MHQLAEDVWIVPSAGSASTLRGCLSKSRAKLVAAGGTAEQLSRTVRLSGGRTLISLPDGWDVDTDRLRQAAAAASVAYESGHFSEARARAAAALQLWYADPLPDAGHCPFAVRYIEELKGIHWSVSLTRIKTDICLGRHREVIAELEELTRQRPNEGEVWMLQAIALYRSDRIPEAVEVCRLSHCRPGRKGYRGSPPARPSACDPNRNRSSPRSLGLVNRDDLPTLASYCAGTVRPSF